MIKIFKNTLEKDLIDSTLNYIKNMFCADVWSSSLGWDQNLSLNSTNILTHGIKEKYICDNIKKSIQDKLKVDFESMGLDFACSVYVWGGGSYITWHDDEPYPYNGTIYLNEKWDSNDGGVFLYRDNQTNSIIGIEPEYNLMVVNSGVENDIHNLHCVTCILPSVVKKRITIQWRTIKRQNKKDIFLYK